jgi:hypothetical protein
LDTVIDLIKSLIAREPARLITWSSAAAIWLVVKGTEAAGYPLAADSTIALAVGTLIGAIVTELIRRIVYAPATVEAIRAGEDQP